MLVILLLIFATVGFFGSIVISTIPMPSGMKIYLLTYNACLVVVEVLSALALMGS